MKLKISRLFHWLYATLMFLPILMFIPSCIYYGFNEHAVINDETIDKYETKQVLFNQQLGQPIESTFYTWHDTYITFDNAGYTGQLVYAYNLVGIDNHIVYFKVNRSAGFTSPGPTYQVYWQAANSSYYGVAYTSDYYYGSYSNPSGNILLRVYDSDIIGKSISFQFFDLTLMFGSGNEPTKAEFEFLFPNLYYPYNDGQQITLQVPTGETITVSNNTRNIEYAWEQVWNLPVFSWTQNSFITRPFSFITGLFGLQENNSINYLFTYFASISICWLVFDLIMYVPNLAHRWLDRSAIE